MVGSSPGRSKLRSRGPPPRRDVRTWFRLDSLLEVLLTIRVAAPRSSRMSVPTSPSPGSPASGAGPSRTDVPLRMKTACQDGARLGAGVEAAGDWPDSDEAGHGYDPAPIHQVEDTGGWGASGSGGNGSFVCSPEMKARRPCDEKSNKFRWVSQRRRFDAFSYLGDCFLGIGEGACRAMLKN